MKKISIFDSMHDYIKDTLGLDIKKIFNVDIDSERKILHDEMRSIADTKLKEEMLQQGVDTETIEKFMTIRKGIRKKIKESKPGLYQYKIETEPK